MELRNLTPHALTVYAAPVPTPECNPATGDCPHHPLGDCPVHVPPLVIPPSGQVARVEVRKVGADEIDGIPVATETTGAVIGLPEPEPGVVLIVSRLVAEAMAREDPHRRDVLSPGQAVRDDAGRIIGCYGLVRAVLPEMRTSAV
jgi:hypothetical protein